MSWPNIAEPATINGRFIKKQNKVGFETGRPVSFAADIIGHYEFTLHWPDMDQDDFDLLAAAVENDIGSEFSWNHFYNGNDYTVIYMEDGFDFNMSEDFVSAHYDVTVKLLHIPTVTGVTTTTTTTTTTTSSTTTV